MIIHQMTGLTVQKELCFYSFAFNFRNPLLRIIYTVKHQIFIYI